MERLLQYFDDLDDFVYTIALLRERARAIAILSAFICLTLLVQSLGIYAAIVNPPITVATGSLLVVGLMYRSVVCQDPKAPAAS